MRTIIDLPEQTVAQLDDIKSSEGVSRNELVKRAVTMLLKTYDKPEVNAFGLWGKEAQQQDGLTYQQNIRDEW